MEIAKFVVITQSDHVYEVVINTEGMMVNGTQTDDLHLKIGDRMIADTVSTSAVKEIRSV